MSFSEFIRYSGHKLEQIKNIRILNNKSFEKNYPHVFLQGINFGQFSYAWDMFKS